MNLDTGFLAPDASAAPAEPTAPIESATTTEAPEAINEVQPSPEVTVTEPTEQDNSAAEVSVEGDSDSDPFDDEEIQRSLSDEKAPKWYREALKKAQGYSHKLKETAQGYESELNDFRTRFDGREALDPTEIERLRAAEERQYKMSSYTATAEDLLTSIQETVPAQKLAELKSHLTWGFLEDANGKPDLENLQVIVDRFSGYKGDGDTQVKAADVLNAISALKRGTLSDMELHEFGSDAEYEAHKKAREMERAAEEQRNLAKSNAEFQERETRKTVLQSVVGNIQSQFQPQVESLLNKFQLAPVEGEPKESAEYKQEIRDKIAITVDRVSANNPHIKDLWNALELLGNPTGARAEQIQQEIQQFSSSFPFQTAVSRGLSELMSEVEKVITREAYRYSLYMEGYKVRASKGQVAREVIGSPKQTEVVTNYTQEELNSMTAAERREVRMKQFNEMVQQAVKPNTPRYGG